MNMTKTTLHRINKLDKTVTFVLVNNIHVSFYVTMAPMSSALIVFGQKQRSKMPFFSISVFTRPDFRIHKSCE